MREQSALSSQLQKEEAKRAISFGRRRLKELSAISSQLRKEEAKRAISHQLSAISFGRRKPKLRDFKELKVWEKAHQLTLAVYKATAMFPRDELYGLTSQIRRSCASIPANIAEGCRRSGEPELARFFHIAMGSASELEYHLLLARDLGLLKDSDYKQLTREVTDVKRMLTSFIQKLTADR